MDSFTILLFYNESITNRIDYEFVYKNIVDPLITLPKAEAIIDSYRRFNIPSSNHLEKRKKTSQPSWCRPPRGFSKINVDVANNAENQVAGLGVVILHRRPSMCPLHLLQENGDSFLLENQLEVDFKSLSSSIKLNSDITRPAMKVLCTHGQPVKQADQDYQKESHQRSSQQR
ncbi:hypothetical protein CUMW_122370, partial [Citrus unshiu]